MGEVFSHPAAWLVLVVAVGVQCVVLWRIFVRGAETPPRDEYMHALELWIEGELAEASDLLRQVVHRDTDAVGPFLHLGNLLRLQGDAARAAVLHRGLTVRPNLTLPQKIAVGLSLADDLNVLQKWDESGAVLDTLLRHATARPHYWRTRFAQRHGEGNRPEAARTLKHAGRHVPAHEGEWFRLAYLSYQLDRALQHALAGESSEAKARLKDVRDFPEGASRTALVQAVIAAVANDAATAVTLASEQLLQHPDELRVFLPLLQDVLLSTGQYSRTIPILERACQAAGAPASLWVDLALLYEKLGQRDKALRFLATKSGRIEFTPAAAAPYLRVLMAEVPDADVGRVWQMLRMAPSASAWRCSTCDVEADHIRWYCDGCGAFDSYAQTAPLGGDS